MRVMLPFALWLNSKALLTANLNRRYQNIRRATSAIAFFGTPHRGGNGATLGQFSINIIRLFTGSDRNDLVKSLNKNSLFLAHLSADFKHIYEDFNYLSIVETRGILKSPRRTIIVDKESAELGLGGQREHVIDLDRDHRQICKLTNDNVFQRIIRQIERLVDLAKKKNMDEQPDDRKQATEEPQSEPRLEVSVATSAPRLSTVNLMESNKFIGHAALKLLLTQWLCGESPSLILHGSPGSGKTSIALEFAQMQQNSYSIFWFTAEDLDSLQSWYNRASRCIAPDRFKDFARNHYRAVTQWLLDPANGKRILIFDNANPDLNFGDILPANVPWGKIMFTSRTKDISREIKQQSYESVFIHMPLLARDEAIDLFMSRCANLKLTEAETLEVYKFSSSLRYSPLALTLAGTHLQMYQRISDLTSAYRDSSDNSDILIQRLTLLLIEDSRMNQRILLWFIYLLGRSSVSLNLINVCQKSRGRLRNLQATTDFLRTSNTGSAINHWVSVGFLQRKTSPSGPIFHIPSSVQNAIEQDLANDREQSENTLKLGIYLVAAIHDGKGIQSIEDVTKYIDTTVAGFRNLCIAARDMSIIVPEDTGAYSQRAALYYIGKTVEEGRALFKRLFWRQWRSLFQYSKPSSPAGEDNIVTAVPNFSFPDWLETQIQGNYDLEDLGHEAVVRDALLAKLWNDLKLAILLSGMGSAWHGIRENVFDFTRRNFHPDFSESQKTSFIDFVDKGGAEGLHSALLKITDTEEFQQEATGRINSEAMDDIVRTICALSNPYILALSEEAIRQAIAKSLEGTMYDVFIEATGAMHDALFSVQKMVETVLEGSLGLASEGEGARQMVHFIVETTGETELRQRCLTMTEGFCEYLDTAKPWIIANTCLHLAHTVLEETMLVQDFDWDWICAIIEFVREGVMPVEKTPGRTGEVAGRRMLYWLEEACNCRSAWGARQDVPFYDFRNQVQWEESCVLMGAESRSWVLS